MAIYHFSGTVISRSQGRSAVACAAYRAAERLHDHRQDITHDYSRKQDVAYTEILLPKDAPEWMKDRETLWNTVEATEKRKDAQLSREFNFALPRELTLAQNIALAKEFVQREFVDKGMVADLCIHTDKSPSGEWQPHAHIMLTMREVTPEGFGQKVREWNAKENLLLWREAWAEVANRHLFLYGHDLRIDHRSLKEQGIDLEPQHKIGAAVAQERLARLEDHLRIARENGEKIYNDPRIALDAITHHQSTFTHQDLARFINRHTVDADQFQRVYDKVKQSEQIVYLGLDDKGRERFTTQEMLALETRLLQQAQALGERAHHVVRDSRVDEIINTRTLSPEQQMALRHLTAEGDLKALVGYAGSGKSYLLGSAREAWLAQGYRVSGTTLSGIAAENLEASSGIESRTLASRLHSWDKGYDQLTARDILVIDEAGMIGSRQMARLLNEVERQGAKLVLVGDPEQLQAIEAGAAYRAILERVGHVELTEIHRQRIPWQQEATRELATGQSAQALERYRTHDHVHIFDTQTRAQQGLLELWNDARISNPNQTQIMLAFTRQEVRELNEAARSLRRAQGELGEDHTLQTARGARQFAEKDRVYFLQTDHELAVKNGTLGTIVGIEGAVVTVAVDNYSRQAEQPERFVDVNLNRYDHLDHGYAATVYKGQGVTVDRSYVLASGYMDRHSTYVGLSRHRDSVDVFYSKETFKNDREFVYTLSRERAKDMSLDYRQQREDFARQRNVEPEAPETKSTERQRDYQKTHDTFNNGNEYDEKQLRAFMATAQRRQAAHEKTTGFSVDKLDDLKSFRQQFERENPQLAEKLSQEILPVREKQALAALKQFQALEEKVLQSDGHERRRQQERLEKQAYQWAKQPQLLQALRAHQADAADRIQKLAKAYERDLDRGLSL